MKNNKIFTFMLLLSLVLFVSFHMIIWQFTKRVYPENFIVGDLARMSYKFGLITPKINADTLAKKHINFKDFNYSDQVDVITIGDSFSNGMGGGENRYYQDYIADKFNFKVLNLPDISESSNYIDTLVILLNSGILDELRPKYIILECVQRNIHQNIGFEEIDTTINYNGNIIDKIKQSKDIFNPTNNIKDEITFINSFNYNVLIYNLRFYLNGYGKYKNYYIEKLNTNLFSSEIKDELIFFRDDISFLKFQTNENIIKLNNRLNQLASLMRKKNIKLYFMPAVDKYNLYRDNMLNKEKYPKSDFFEYLEGLKKDYIFIDTKKIFIDELNSKNIIDLYYSDDTHWSYKARELIVNKIEFK